MFDTNSRSVVLDNDIGYVSKITRRFIKPTEQFKGKTQVVFLIVCHFANSL
jgi:hypothetical protein